MEREDRLNIIFTQFDASAKQFCEETNGVYCDISSEYKGDALPQNLRFRYANIYYNAFTVKFNYTAHGALSTVNSILDCTVCLGKNDASCEIPLPLISDYCGKSVSNMLCVPLITSAEGMQQAFASIGGTVKQLLTEFSKISCDPEYKARILTVYDEECRYIFELDDLNGSYEGMEQFFCGFFTQRFSSTPFLNWLKGNRAKAVKQLSKVKKLTGYEKRLLETWSSQEQEESLALSAIVSNAAFYNESGVQKANLKEFAVMFLSWLLMTPVIGGVYVGLFFLCVFIESRESVYLMGPVYNFPICIMLGFVTSIAVSYFTRFRFYKLFFKKNYEQYCEQDHIQNGGGADKLMKGFLWFLVVLSVMGCILIAKWNLNFMPDGFIDNSRFLSFRGEYHAYGEIQRVYYRADRVNDFGDKLDAPSYVLVLKNGTEIDLYEHGDISDYEKTLIDYFRTKGIRVDVPNR